MKQFKLGCVLALGALALASCSNQDNDFPNFEGGTAVYFAYQYPIRTIVLGEDQNFDTTMDNEHRFAIYAVMGGAYKNDKTVTIDVAVDNSLTENLFFYNAEASAVLGPVVPMPQDYYTMDGNKIVLNGKMNGSVGFELSDAFFDDPQALENTYVLPLVMNRVANADSILSGIPLAENPVRTNPADWDVAPKDYVLYAVKFINPWHGNYLRRGVDQITEDGGATSTNVRRTAHVESDQLNLLTSAGLTTLNFPVSIANADGGTTTCNLLLSFGESGTCTITTTTDGMTASGTGKFVVDGEKLAWGNKDRDALYLDYTVDFGDREYVTRDTLVARDRGILMGAQQFAVTYVNE